MWLGGGFFQSIADRIDTGLENSDRSRALVVFNPANESLIGVALFPVDMSWHFGVPLPPVLVINECGERVPSAVTDYQESEDLQFRPGRIRVTFSLRFLVSDIPARGWRTYIAEYADALQPNASEALGELLTELVVVETLRHLGNLPMTAENGF